MLRDIRKTIAALAKKRGGTCISLNATRLTGSLLIWRCKSNHPAFTKTVSEVRKGEWCPQCPVTMLQTKETARPGDKPKNSFKKLDRGELRNFEKKYSGICFIKSKSYKFPPIWWRCKIGHESRLDHLNFQVAPRCDHCHADRIAAAKGGKCTSRPGGENSRCKRRWRCRLGHDWLATSAAVIRGAGCGTCAEKNKNEIPDDVNPDFKFWWKCDRGHRWTSEKVKGGYREKCPHCAGSKKISAFDLKRLAKKMNGKCLMIKGDPISLNQPIDWECSDGHRLSATPLEVKAGKWCGVCANCKKADKIAA